jgi:hypothetical protein
MIAITRIALTVLALVAGVTVAAGQNRGVQVGNGIKLTLRGVPADDAAQVTGLYQVAENGTIRLPHLDTRLRVLGLKAGQVSEAEDSAYRCATAMALTDALSELAGRHAKHRCQCRDHSILSAFFPSIPSNPPGIRRQVPTRNRSATTASTQSAASASETNRRARTRQMSEQPAAAKS